MTTDGYTRTLAVDAPRSVCLTSSGSEINLLDRAINCRTIETGAGVKSGKEPFKGLGLRCGRRREKARSVTGFPRGPVIGPLVVAGVSIEESRIRELQSLGIRDSKTLTPLQRAHLADGIRSVAHEISIVELAPSEIDEFVLKGRRLRKLNYLEAIAMAKVIAKLNPTIAYVDSSDVKADRFARDILGMLPAKINIVSRHHADEKYPVVSAASIIAKVTRDQRIDEIKKVHGEFGSGYPSDPRTVRFLREWFRRNGSFPDFVRKSWKTVATIEQKIRQSTL